jgi:glycosyl transferase, family 25
MTSPELQVNLINLDRSTDRLAEFAALNAHLGEVLRFSAIDGHALDLSALVGAGLVTPDILDTYSLGALGCAMSHIALWKRAVAHGQPQTIAEDDAIFHGAFQRLAAGVVAGLRPDWDIILWGWNFDLFVSIEMFPGVSPCLAQFEGITSEADVRAFQQQELEPHPLKVRWAFGTPCYSISPNGARAIMSKCLPLRPLILSFPECLRAAPHSPYFKTVGIDVTLNAVYRELRAFICFPPLVVTRNEISKSTISTSR